MTMMSDKKLRRIAEDFRDGILCEGSSRRMCFMITAPLQGYLSYLGCETELIEGEIDRPDHVAQHFWLRLPDGRILDPTADQFTKPDGSAMPCVYVGERPAWYRLCQPAPAALSREGERQ